MTAYHFGTLVDLYNNVPYSDAFKVATSVQPTYDNGQDNYNDLVAQIDSAIILFDLAKDYYAGAAAVILTVDDQYDILYGTGGSGDPDIAADRMDAWVRFANTLELKLLIHQSEIASQTIYLDQITKIEANGRGFIGPTQSAIVNTGYQKSVNKISPLYGVFQGVSAATTSESYYRAHQYAIDFYDGTSDPRIEFFYAVVNGGFAGNFDGDPASVSNAETSAVGPGVLKGPSQNVMIMSDFESLFLQAEAAERGWTTGDPQALFESAVTQSFDYIYRGGDNSLDPSLDPAADAADLVSNGIEECDYAASTDKLFTIITRNGLH